MEPKSGVEQEEKAISPQKEQKISIQDALALARQLFEQNDLLQAEQVCLTILKLQSRHAIALDMLGVIYYQQNQLEKAIDCYQKAIDSLPDNANFYSHLGAAQQGLGQFENAIESQQHAIKLNPNEAAYHYNLGYAYNEAKSFEKAIHCYQQALEIDPAYNPCFNNLGLCFNELGDYDKAIATFEKAINAASGDPYPYNNLSVSYNATGDIDKARKCLHKALELNPSYTAAMDNLGQLEDLDNHYPEAKKWFDKLISLNPEHARAHYHFALAMLGASDIPHAWKEFEWRKRLPELGYVNRDYPQPLWDGNSIKDQTILIYTEQGFGDTLQFFRFTKLIKAKKIIVQCHKSLVRLLKTASWIDDVIEKNALPPAFDCHLPLLSIPYVLNLDNKQTYKKMVYLTPEKTLVKEWKKKIDNPKAFNIGLVWSGNPKQQKHNTLRSCPVELLLSLSKIKEVALYSLQKGSASRELEHISQEKIINLIDDLHDFADTAALIANLDLVISIDTAVLHLAGTMGSQTFALLNTKADWRWKEHHPPWYSNMRYFRQQTLNDWQSVIQDVTKALMEK